jgi:hypothetical protein
MNDEKVQVEREEAIWFKVYNQIIEDMRLNRMDILVYSVLCYHADRKKKTNKSWPSYETIMKEARIDSKTTVSKSLKRLEEYGYLTAKHDPGKHNVYTLKVLFQSSPPSEQRCPLSGQGSPVSGLEQDPLTRPINKTQQGVLKISSVKYGCLEVPHKQLNTLDQDAIDTAASLLENYPGSVKAPTGFFIRAVNEGWKPDLLEDIPRIKDAADTRERQKEVNNTENCMSKKTAEAKLHALGVQIENKELSKVS